MRTIFLYIVNAMAALVYAYCYVMDPLNIGTSKWNLAPLIFICAFFLLKYLYTKFDCKRTGNYAFLTTTLIFIVVSYLV